MTPNLGHPPAEIAASSPSLSADVATCTAPPSGAVSLPVTEAIANAPLVEPAAIRSELDILIDEHWHRMVFATSVESKLLWGERYAKALRQRRAAP